uniref:Uncharacterized protein n=1 Tax=Schizaphis graminum TaxID=13262 RepID=A0A2S2NEV8_SCHGA
MDKLRRYLRRRIVTLFGEDHLSSDEETETPHNQVNDINLTHIQYPNQREYAKAQARYQRQQEALITNYKAVPDMTLRDQVVMVNKKGEISQLTEEELVTNEEEIVAAAEEILRKAPPQHISMIIQERRTKAEEEEQRTDIQEATIPNVIEPSTSASNTPSKRQLKRLRFKNLRHNQPEKK